LRFTILMPMRQICAPNVDIFVFFEELIGVSAFLPKFVSIILRQKCRSFRSFGIRAEEINIVLRSSYRAFKFCLHFYFLLNVT